MVTIPEEAYKPTAGFPTDGRKFRPNKVIRLGTHYDVVGQVDHHSNITPSSFVGWMPINYKHRRTGSVYLEGGGWWATRKKYNLFPSSRMEVRGTFKEYAGSFYCDVGDGAELGSFPDWEAQAIMAGDLAIGATNLARYSPTKPLFQAATSLYEMKDTPRLLRDAVHNVRKAVRDEIVKRGGSVSSPRRRVRAPGPNRNPTVRPLPRTGRSKSSKTAQWFLAVNFGWLPILNDVRNFVNAQRERDKRLRNLIRNESRPVKRRSVVSRDNSIAYNTKTVHSGPNNPNMAPSLTIWCYDGDRAETHDYRDTIKETWFEGQCRYMLPPGPRDQIWNRKMMRRIMGARVTPDAIYNVMPWSWLVDYFIDVGSFIEAANNGVADILIWDYAYLMRTYSYRFRRICSQNVRDQTGTPRNVTASAVMEVGWKFRTPATLFGFGVKQTDLSVRQLAVLGALGFSRLP